MEKKFTQGEWVFDKEFESIYSLDKSVEGNIICEAPVYWTESMKNWEANAKLIVAAEDLLKACLTAKAMYEAQGINENSRIGGEQYTELLKAIKKALE